MVSGVEVLLAAYNGERYLPELLDSLAAQDAEGMTVLWQDDGSSDGTVALLEARSAADPRFRPAAAQGEHRGAKGNFLSLLGQSHARYTAFCDQDDLWLPDHLSLQLKRMEELEARWGAETPLLVHGDAEVVASDGSFLQASFFRHQGWDPEAVTLNRLLVQNNVTGCTALVNAPLRRLVCAHARAEELYMHDWFVALTAAAFGHIGFVDRPLLRYRQHGGNVKGASRQGLRERGLRAFFSPERGKARIALSYRHTRAFLDAYGDDLPPEARRTAEGYLATQAMPKLRRIRALRAGGYTMQSPITRAGQILFG